MPAWHILVMSLPTRHTTERMRVWRALKAMGCGVLRDGVYLLPAVEGAHALLERQAAAVIGAGGHGHVLALNAGNDAQEDAFRRLFERSADYAELKIAIDSLRRKLKRGPLASLAREGTQLQKTFAALAALDYFPGSARDQVQALLDELMQQIAAKLHPGEPQAASGRVQRLDRAHYQARVWATRKNLWVDRMASAWLIARFIDRKAKFKWLSKPEDCPKKAVGFDFDGAAFTHVGSRVSFEVLLASFGLDEDAALMRIGNIVHALDVGGVPVAEAAGLEAVLKGLRATALNDDSLLATVAPVFDGLYAGFDLDQT
jgi:hypothetical protein